MERPPYKYKIKKFNLKINKANSHRHILFVLNIVDCLYLEAKSSFDFWNFEYRIQ